MDRVDVAIVGRGAVGLAAALALARPGRRVALIGRRAAPLEIPSADWDPRVFALSPASRALLAAVGAWARLDESRIAAVYDMRIVNGAGVELPEVHLDAYRSRIEALAWIVENRNLMSALAARVADAVAGGRIVEIDGTVTGLVPPAEGWERPGPTTLTIAPGTADGDVHRLQAALVVAADGTESAIREFAGIPARRIEHRQTAIVANFESERPTRDAAWQWFGAHGVLALLPLPAPPAGPAAGRLSLVWSVPDDRLDAAKARPLAESIADITAERHGWLRPIGPMRSFSLRSIRARTVLAPGVVLVGDAAHAIHPMAGQGMNLGFGDVAALARTVDGGPAAEPLGARLRLRRYERSRAEAVTVMQAGLSALERLFAPPPVGLPAPIARIRDVGWRVVARSGWLRRQMVRHAVS